MALLERILGDIRDLFNPYHDPANGRFTTTATGGQIGTVYSKGGHRGVVASSAPLGPVGKPVDPGKNATSQELLDRVLLESADYEDPSHMASVFALERKQLSEKLAVSKLALEQAERSFGTDSSIAQRATEAVRKAEEALVDIEANATTAAIRFAESNNRLMGLLAADNPVQLTLADGDMTGVPRKRWHDDAQRVLRLIDSSVINANGTASLTITKSTGKVSFYEKKTINVLSRAHPPTIAHEMGHWVEDVGGPSTLNAAIRFLDRRCAGQKPQTIGGAGGSYTLRMDRFADAYTGRDYVARGKRYATEVISSGMEHLMRDVAGFARSDPDHFRFTIDVLRGRTK